MTSSMEHFKKKYDLEIVEEDGEIISIHYPKDGGKVELKLEEDGSAWVAKQDNFYLWIPVYR